MLARNRWHFLVGSIVLLVLLLLCSAKNRQKDEFSLIGIPDGAAGLLVRYVLDQKMGTHLIQDIRFEPYALYDCCASATQYAMGSGRLDVAILCPDAARELIEKDRRFEIAGPVIMNSDIFITHPNADLHQPQIAVSQKRAHQREMVVKRFGAKSSAVPMYHGAVPFAFAKGAVQGAVLDITKTFTLEGEITSAMLDGHDICTYVLVNKKSLQKSSRFHQFLAGYEKAVREMENASNLLWLMQTYISADITIGDVKKWKKMNVRFAYPSSFLPQE